MSNKKTPQQPDAQALPFPPEGAPIDPDGMVAEALRLGGVVRLWRIDADFYNSNHAKQYSESEIAKEVTK